MRIRKTSETRPLASHTVNAYSESESNAYSCDYVNKLNTYSTTERRIGTYTNGKPLYEKTLTVNTGTTLDLWSSIAHNISNVDFIMITNAFFINGNSDKEMLPNSDTQVAINNTNIRLVLKNASMKNRNMTLIVAYTKTTDTVQSTRSVNTYSGDIEEKKDIVIDDGNNENDMR